MKASLLWKKWSVVARKNPQQVALIDASKNEIFTRLELTETARILAQGIFAEAVQQRVALCWPNGLTWVASFLALQKVGAAVVPLDSSLPAEAQESAARAAKAQALFSAQLGWVVLSKRMSKRVSKRRLSGDEVCVKVTSGSTGRPKQILCRDEHLLADGRQILRGMNITSDDRNLALIPLGHSYGLGNLVLPLILEGVSLVTAESFVPGQIAPWVDKYRITVFPTVPEIVRILAQLPGKNALKPLRLVISAAAPLPAKTAQDFSARYGLRVHNFYGSSETGGICFDATGESSEQGRALGRPLPGVKIEIKKSGRIWVRSAAVTHPSGNFKLPDLGAWSPEGELQLHGRAGGVVNIGGKKIAPAELEMALRKIAQVTEAWVTIGGAKERPYLAAVVETVRAESEIMAALREQVPSWKLPRILKTAQPLPRTERGKLDTKILRSWLSENQASSRHR